MNALQKKAWKKDNQIWRVLDLTGGEVFASSPNETWRGTIAEFREAFVDANIKSEPLVIEQYQIWQHIQTGIKHATISRVIESRIFMENLLDGTSAWWPIDQLLNDFERVMQ
jgi:hypothetical protein